MMNPGGNTQRKTSTGSEGKGNSRHRKLSKLPSDSLTQTANKQIAVKDIYSTNQNLSKVHNCFDVDPVSGSNSSLRRLSQSGIAPASDEFKSVLKDLGPQPTEIKPKSNKTQSKAKHRKISFNEFGRASRFAKRLEDLSPRPKRSIDSLTNPSLGALHNRPSGDYRKFDSTAVQSRKSSGLHGIKEAWNAPERPVRSQAERRRHVSLPAPPSGFSLDKLVYYQETVVEPFQQGEKRKKSVVNSSSRPGRKISTVAPPNMSQQSRELGETEKNVRKFSGNSSSCEDNDVTPYLMNDHFKSKQFAAANGPQDLHPNLLLGIKTKQGNDRPSRLEKQPSIEDTAGEQHVALKAHKNFKRVGKAALAAKRFLKIQNEEAQEVQKRSISPLAKEDKDFDEMVEAMKTSYQKICLSAEKNNTDIRQ